MTRRPTIATLLHQVDAWNASTPIRTMVEYRSHPEAEPQLYHTRTAASILSGHTAVVWLEGKSGCVAIEACRPVRAGQAA